MSLDLRLVRDDALGPDALGLIAQSEAELAALYPPEVRFAFSPQELTDAGAVFFVGYAGDTAAACGGFVDLGEYCELKRMFVARPFRGMGAAAVLLDTIEAQARSIGSPLMRLETGSDSPVAIRAYGRAGYSRRAPFGNYVENGSSVFMEKRL